MGGNSNSKVDETDSNSSKVFQNSLKQKSPKKPLSEEIPNDLNRSIVVELQEVNEETVVVDNQGNYKEDSEDTSRFRVDVRNVETGAPVPDLDVRVSLIRRSDGLRFGPYRFPFLCGLDSFCYSRDLQIPDGEYKLEAVIQPEKQHSGLEELVGRVRAVFRGVEVS